MNHPLLGHEYSVEGEVIDADSVVPIEYDDTGNLVVDQYNSDSMNTVSWNEDAFIEYVDDSVLVE